MVITVFGASSGAVSEKYMTAARELGTLLARGGHTLVNGAGLTGLMGACADACLAAGGEAVGVIPQFMVDRHWQHPGMTRLEITSDMHARKERMAELSEACIALPGGVGTLEELLEIITWKQLGLYPKPIVILNVADYFKDLLCMLDRAVREKFMREEHASLWVVAPTPAEALKVAMGTPLLNEIPRKVL